MVSLSQASSKFHLKESTVVQTYHFNTSQLIFSTPKTSASEGEDDEMLISAFTKKKRVLLFPFGFWRKAWEYQR